MAGAFVMAYKRPIISGGYWRVSVRLYHVKRAVTTDVHGRVMPPDVQPGNACAADLLHLVVSELPAGDRYVREAGVLRRAVNRPVGRSVSHVALSAPDGVRFGELYGYSHGHSCILKYAAAARVSPGRIDR